VKRYEVWTALRANDGVDPGERQGPGAYDARVEALERNGDDSIFDENIPLYFEWI
jgi:hypothetical protein